MNNYKINSIIYSRYLIISGINKLVSSKYSDNNKPMKEIGNEFEASGLKALSLAIILS